jgi:hypothetical protein
MVSCPVEGDVGQQLAIDELVLVATENGHRNLQFEGQDYRILVQGVVSMVQNWVGEHARAQLGTPLRQGEQR